MEHRDRAIVAAREEHVAVEAPAEVGDAHHAEVHDHGDWLLPLRLPYSDSRVLGHDCDDAVAVDGLPACFVKPRVDAADVDRTLVTGKARAQPPAAALDQWRHELSADAATRRGYEGTVRRPAEPPIDRHAHALFEELGYLRFERQIAEVLNPPNLDALLLARLRGEKLAERVKS